MQTLKQSSSPTRCECSASGLCSIRKINVRQGEQIVCSRAGFDAAEKIISARLSPPTVTPNRTVGRVASATPRSTCSTCGGKKRGAIARAVDRVVSLKKAAVDFLADGMQIATDEQQAKRSAICASCPLNNNGWCDDTKGGCGCNLALKVQPRSSSCPLGKWSAYRDDYRPLVNPTRSLMFHLYPLKGKEWNWHGHIDQIRRHQDKFNGKIVIGVSSGGDTWNITDVQALFDGIRVTDWVHVANAKALAETLTHTHMLEKLKTDDPNAVIFRAHTKGVTHQRDSVEQRWAEIMWSANMDLPSVDDALASHGAACCLRSQTPLVKKKPGDWFPAGSFYWMRAKEVFERDWTHTDKTRWFVEYAPCHLFSFEESACIFHDLVPSSVLNHAYFAEHVDPEWAAWKAARGIE